MHLGRAVIDAERPDVAEEARDDRVVGDAEVVVVLQPIAVFDKSDRLVTPQAHAAQHDIRRGDGYC